jgi:hypothetical protein
MSGGVIAEGSPAWHAIGWQKAGVEGILRDIDADPGSRGGVVLCLHGLSSSSS